MAQGTFSQIYSAYSIEDGGRVAVKVEAPSSLKPVLEWESVILKSLQDCPHVCRYYYHGYDIAVAIICRGGLSNFISPGFLGVLTGNMPRARCW